MKFNIHGWEHLSGNHPEIVGIRKDVLQQLGEVSEPHRSVWDKRLKSKLDHSHFSVRLEIYLHEPDSPTDANDFGSHTMDKFRGRSVCRIAKSS